MSVPTPRGAAPGTERRKTLVAEAMAQVTDIEHLPTGERTARLDEAQRLLSAALQDAPMAQAGIPGITPKP